MRIDWIELIPVTYPIVNGRQTPTEGIRLGCWAEKKGIKREEFYKAAWAGVTIDAVFEVSAIDYTAQERLVYDGVAYEVIRAYPVKADSVELTCRKRVGA